MASELEVMAQACRKAAKPQGHEGTVGPLPPSFLPTPITSTSLYDEYLSSAYRAYVQFRGQDAFSRYPSKNFVLRASLGKLSGIANAAIDDVVR